MTKARDLANIISGGFTADDIPNLDASKIATGTFGASKLDLTDTYDFSSGSITLPAGVGGKVLQVVQNYEAGVNANLTTTSTAYVASGIQASITPTASGNLILVNYSCTVVDSQGNVIRSIMYQKIGAGSFAPMTDAGEYQVGLSYDTFNRYAPFIFNGSYTTTSTDTLTFEPYVRNTDGTTAVRYAHAESSYALTLTEIAQ